MATPHRAAARTRAGGCRSSLQHGRGGVPPPGFEFMGVSNAGGGTPPLRILDYGMANLRSVQKAFEAVGSPAQIIATPDEVRATDLLVLPGVARLRTPSS